MNDQSKLNIFNRGQTTFFLQSHIASCYPQAISHSLKIQAYSIGTSIHQCHVKHSNCTIPTAALDLSFFTYPC